MSGKGGKDWFELFETDKKGLVTERDLIHLVKFYNLNPSELNLVKNENEPSEKIDHQVDSEHELINAFRAFDKDQSGFISVLELRSILLQLAENLREDEVDNFLASSEVNFDGYINYEDFARKLIHN